MSDITKYPRYDEALKLAAGHFLSNVPENMSGQQIVDTLNQYHDEEIDELPDDLVLWDRFDTGCEEDGFIVAELIESLADAFVRFAYPETCEPCPTCRAEVSLGNPGSDVVGMYQVGRCTQCGTLFRSYRTRALYAETTPANE